MPLPKEYIEGNQQDITMRLSRSIIMFKQKPVIVLGNMSTRRGVVLHLCTGGLSILKDVPIDHDELSVDNLGSHLGFLKTSQGMLHCSRVPVRQFCQGLNINNMHIYLIQQKTTNKKYKSLNANARSMCKNGSFDVGTSIGDQAINIGREWNINYVLLWILSRPNFIDMWNDNYSNAAGHNRPGYHALSRQYYVDSKGVVYSHGIDNIVGEFVGKRIRYESNKEYLSQSIERLTGIMPI